MSIRVLSKELQDKAEKELHENPGRIKDDIQHIKDWIKQASYLNARTEDQWILSFLRGCKFSLERTKEKLDMFYTMRSILPEFFKNRDPFLPEIQKILDLGIYLPLPKAKSPDSPRIVLMRIWPFDPKINLADTFKVNLMLLDILMMEDDQFIIAGQTGIQDLKEVSLNHIATFVPATIKKAMTCFLTAYPTRPKASHFLNTPNFFELIYSLFGPFLTEKMRKRMVVHPGNSWDNLYQDIPKELLPKEYGGENGSVEDLIKHWKAKVESYKDWFLDDEKYGTTECKRPGKPKTSDNVFGLEGSFRKLNVD